MSPRNKYMARLRKQKELEPDNHEIPMLMELLEGISTQREWEAITKVDWIDGRMHYRPSPLLLILWKYFEEMYK